MTQETIMRTNEFNDGYIKGFEDGIDQVKSGIPIINTEEVFRKLESEEIK